MKPLPTTIAGLEAELRQRRLFLATLGQAYQVGDTHTMHYLLADFVSGDVAIVFLKGIDGRCCLTHIKILVQV
jgi:hypothetical protein